MEQRVRHLLSVLLVCAMVLSILPISVLAEELETPLTTVTEPANVPEVEGEPKEDPEPEPEPEPEAAQTIYVSSEGSDETGNGNIDKPYASLAKAVKHAQEAQNSGNTFIIELLSNLTSTKYAIISGLDITIKGNGHTITRGTEFTPQNDGRGGYNPAMIEVANGAQLTLLDITLDDAFLEEADTSDGKDPFREEGEGNDPNVNDNSDKVQDAIIAAYGDGEGTIILGNGTTLKNFGGMSAVRVGGNGVINNPQWKGSTLIMKSGSQIIDDDNAQRKGGYGAIWNQGGKVEIEQGASIHSIDGRAIFAEDGSTTTINGSIYDITSNETMRGVSAKKPAGDPVKGGGASTGFGGIVANIQGNATVTLGNTGKIYDINSHDNKSGDVAFFLNASGRFHMLQGSSITNINIIGLADSNEGIITIDGTIRDIDSGNVLFRLRGGSDVVFELGGHGVITDCKTTDYGIIYKNGGRPKITISGEISNVSAKSDSAIIFISPNDLMSGGFCNITETGKIKNGSVTAISAGDRTHVSIYGEISGCKGYAVEYRYLAESLVTIFSGSVIEGNNSGGEQIALTNEADRSASDTVQHIEIAPGTLIGNQSIVTPFGTITLDEGYSAIQLGKASQNAVNTIETSVQVDHPEWTAVNNTLWFKPSEDSFHLPCLGPLQLSRALVCILPIFSWMLKVILHRMQRL